ncbi:MAG TPA: SufD family Fe-S cluster assembly protein, partial [Cytophagaceae bacterium]
MEKTINNTNLKDNFISLFKNNEKDFLFSASQSLVNKKKEAIRLFEKNGFPTTKNEEWKYTNISNVLKENFNTDTVEAISDISLQDFLYKGLEANIVVFVNGVFNKSLSKIISDNLEIVDLSGLNNELLDTYFSASINPETDGFTALNTALSKHGACIRVAKNKVVELPVLIYYISDTRNGNITYNPRNIIVCEENSQLKVIESFHSIGDTASLSNIITEVFVKESANVQYYKIQNENEKAVHVGTTQVIQDTKSYFSSTTITLGGGLIRNNLNIKLQGEHAEADLFGLYLSNNTQHTDNHTLVDHAVPNCLSNELYKGILNGKSSGVFNGKIIVRP